MGPVLGSSTGRVTNQLKDFSITFYRSPPLWPRRIVREVNQRGAKDLSGPEEATSLKAVMEQIADDVREREVSAESIGKMIFPAVACSPGTKPPPSCAADGVEAQRQPGTVWEVYVGAPAEELGQGPKSPYFVGTVSLFSVGIRSETHEREPGKEHKKTASFAFPINRAVRAALNANERSKRPAADIQGEIRQHIEPGSEVFTDEWMAYHGLIASTSIR